MGGKAGNPERLWGGREATPDTSHERTVVQQLRLKCLHPKTGKFNHQNRENQDVELGGGRGRVNQSHRKCATVHKEKEEAGGTNLTLGDLCQFLWVVTGGRGVLVLILLRCSLFLQSLDFFHHSLSYGGGRREEITRCVQASALASALWQVRWQVQACPATAHRKRHAQTHKHTHTQTHTHTHTQTHAHTNTQTHAHTNTQTHKHTNTHTQTHTCTNTHKHTQIHVHTHKHTHAQTHTCTNTHMRKHNPMSSPECLC